MIRLGHSALRRLTTAAALAATLLAAAAGDALAQASTTTGAIRGRVTGEQGEPMTGAVVTATNEQTGFARSAQADDEGTFTLRFLPVGSYRLAARRIGSAPTERAGVAVVVGATATVNLTLRAAAVQLQQVQISAQAQGIDAAEAGVRTTVTEEQISGLPALGRDFTDFINLSPLVSPTPETTTGGQFSIAGQRPSQTNIQIDGADANNSFFGENRGGSRIPFNFSLESIREFQIITNGYDVEYGNYSGGIVNILTKGGTNKFKGSVYGNYRGDQLTAKDFNGADPRDFSAQQYSAVVSGPIKKDKSFFLFSLDGQRRREPFQPLNPKFLRDRANGVFSGLASRPATDTLRRRDSLSAVTDTTFARGLERFYNILHDQYGITDPGSGYDRFNTSNDVITAFGRLDFNLGEKNRLSVRDNFSKYNNANETFSDVLFGGVSKAEAFKNRTNSLVSELNTAFSQSRFNVLRLQYSEEHRPRVGNNLLPELRVTNVAAGQRAAYGGQSIAFNNNLDERKFQVIDNFSFAVGDHGFKIGTNSMFSWFANRFWNQGSGFYTFPDLDALQNFRPSLYTRSLRADGQPPESKFSTQDYSAYAQDDWQLHPRVLASLGLRYDVSRYGDRPGRVIDVERAFGFQTGIAPVDKNNVSPRASVAYDVRGDASMVLRVGGGLFYGRVPTVVGSNVDIADVPFLQLSCGGSIADNAPDRPPTPADYKNWPANASQNPTNCGGGTGVGGVPTYTFWDKSFEIPETYKGNVSWEQQLFSPKTTAKVDFVYTGSNKLYTVRDINLRSAQFKLANEANRLVFVPAARFNPSSAAPLADRSQYVEFGNLYANYNDGVSRSQSVSLELTHRFNDSTSLTASYSYIEANDNSSYSCCTANEGFTNTRVGALGPNYIGAIKDLDAGWGPSAFVRPHTLVVNGQAVLPFKLKVSAIWRFQSGTAWSPEQGGDLNGDGVSFNDRPFIFKPEELPVASSLTDSTARAAAIQAQRDRYKGYLAQYDCISKYQGRIIPRNVCRQPSFNRLDLSFRRRFDVGYANGRFGGMELMADLFNVLNGINKDWGQYTAITAANRNLVTPSQYNAATGQIEYTVPTGFGSKSALGSNLLLQFSAQLGARLYF